MFKIYLHLEFHKHIFNDLLYQLKKKKSHSRHVIVLQSEKN